MKLELFIAFRYLIATRKRFLNLLLTGVSIAGIAVGVAALIITTSVMNGFQTDIKDKILSLSPHLVIYSGYNASLPEELLASEQFVASSDFIYGQTILKKGRASIGVVVKGIDSEKEKNVTSLENSLRKKDTSLLGDKKIFIGSELSKNLAISPDSNVVLISPTGDSLVPGIIPKMENYKVADIFESGMYEYDSNMVYIRIEDANDLFAGNAIRGKGIKIKDVFAADDAAEDLRNKLGPGFTVKSWNDMNKNLFSALKLEKFVMFLILTLIVIVATFNVISLLAVTTVEKIHSVGILKAIGAGPASITRIFLCLGSIIGILGSSLGMFFGLVICYLLQKYKFISLPADIYYINKLPVKIFVADVVVIMTVAFLVTLISSVYPAWKAGRIEPCEAIRYE